MVFESFIATFATKSHTSNGGECWDVLSREAAATIWSYINRFSTKIFFLGFALGIRAGLERSIFAVRRVPLIFAWK